MVIRGRHLTHGQFIVVSTRKYENHAHFPAKTAKSLQVRVVVFIGLGNKILRYQSGFFKVGSNRELERKN